jgi:ABC-type molybdate transport system substrate-binding protein
MQKSIGLVLIICFFLSCKQPSNATLIIGTWGQKETKRISKARITFFQNNVALFYSIGNPASQNDSILYKLSNDEKSISFSEKKGKNVTAQIYKLTKNELVLISKKDTLRLERK